MDQRMVELVTGSRCVTNSLSLMDLDVDDVLVAPSPDEAPLGFGSEIEVSFARVVALVLAGGAARRARISELRPLRDDCVRPDG
jgi:hypothetical protein